MEQALLLTVTALMYCKVQSRIIITKKWYRFFFITKWDKWYEVGQVLQNGVGISKQGNFHDKVGLVLQSRAVQHLD